MKKLRSSLLMIACILAIPLVYLGSIYASLPAIVPMHFGADGLPDSYGPKSEMFIVVLLLDVVAFGIYLLIKNIHRIDPKKSAKYNPENLQNIALTLVLFLTALNVVLVYAGAHGALSINKIIFPLLGIFFACLGNFMYSVKPNYFVGIRTPWTLENDEVWRKTHQLGGKLWFAGGLFIAIGTLLLSGTASFIYFITIVGIITIIPVGYSFYIFKKLKNA